MSRSDVPAQLGVTFTVNAARRAGMSPARLRSRDLERPFHGARAVVGAALVADDDRHRAYPRSQEAKRIRERAAQYAPVMSSVAFFIGITAAVLWDAPLDSRDFRTHDDSEPLFDPEVLEVAVRWPERAPRCAGVRGHAVRPALMRTVAHPDSGLRLTTPASTWATLGHVLWHPYDLVAVADHFVRIRRPPHTRPEESVVAPMCRLDQLSAAARAGRRVGVANLRAALPRVRTGSVSRPETWTRLTLVDGGLPEPALDHDVFDGDGRFLARVDMAYPGWKIVVEYEGTHHSTGEQWERDVERYARLESEGWRVIRVTRAMLFRAPDALVTRVRAAIAERAR